MLNQIKKHLGGITNRQLLEIINDGREKKIHEERLYYWEKRKIWPLWALEKCGIIKDGE